MPDDLFPYLVDENQKFDNRIELWENAHTQMPPPKTWNIIIIEIEHIEVRQNVTNY